MAELKFPEGFYWGSATSSHQIEGGNHNDWTEWEVSPKRIAQLKKEGKNPGDFISGQACDSYNRYGEDFDLAKKLNQNSHRFSIEWSRIEPEEGRFDDQAMQHYIDIVKALRDRGIEPLITLWHFTNPIWFAEKGGFLNKKSPEYFTRYIKYVVDNLKDRVGLWITFNEPLNMYGGLAYVKGIWPPQHKNFFELLKLSRNFIRAHTLAYREIKNIYGPNSSLGLIPQAGDMSHNVGPFVGIVETNRYPVGGTRLIRRLFNEFRNLYFWRRTLPYQDFLGLNYYTIFRLPGSYKILPQQDIAQEMQWEIYPKGLYHCLEQLKKFNKPIFVTENGIGDGTDTKREKFIKDHLKWVHRAIQNGVDVRGYTYWSLLDNFEWAFGFGPRFGLVEVDYKTLERRIRPSALEYAKICMTNRLEVD